MRKLTLLVLAANLILGHQASALCGDDSRSELSVIPESAIPKVKCRRIEGQASKYANKFHGRRTASGERYSQKHLTAAHRTLPFGTRVLVSNKETGRQVSVRVNDRGPFAKGREIDLSAAAARMIGMKDLADVEIQICND